MVFFVAPGLIRSVNRKVGSSSVFCELFYPIMVHKLLRGRAGFINHNDEQTDMGNTKVMLQVSRGEHAGVIASVGQQKERITGLGCSKTQQRMVQRVTQRGTTFSPLSETNDCFSEILAQFCRVRCKTVTEGPLFVEQPEFDRNSGRQRSHQVVQG